MIDLPLLSIPSPPVSGLTVFGFQLRFYALSIIAGIIVGYLIFQRRWQQRGGRPESIELVVAVAVPFGIVGARLYHVITDYQLYFGPGRDPLDALKIWQGGLGVWGAVALGALGAYLVARRRKLSFAALADAAAPGLLVAQAIGRLGNWFNQEVFGRPTTLPWALEIAPQHRPAGYEQFATFHPTFLYEILWCLGACVVLIMVDRRFRLGHGQVFALYVALYTAGPVLDRGAADRPGQRGRWHPAQQPHLRDRLRGRRRRPDPADQAPARPGGRRRGTSGGGISRFA